MDSKIVKIKWVSKDRNSRLQYGDYYFSQLSPFNKPKGQTIGTIQIYLGNKVICDYYYPDESLFIIEEIKGIEKEISDLHFMGYRNG